MGTGFTNKKQQAAMIVGPIRSIIRMSRPDYCVLERLANSGHIRKKHTLIDYGSGKGRVSIFMAYQTGCHSIGIEYDERLYEKALLNGEAQQRAIGCVLCTVMRRSMNCQPQADRCFFFNPFALHTIKRVLGNIFDLLIPSSA